MIKDELEKQQIKLAEKIKPTVRPNVYGAFLKIGRHNFCPPEYRNMAYRQPIIPYLNSGFGISCMSDPTLIAKMIDLLDLHGWEKIFEGGTGSGYSTALLACCSGHVFSKEYNYILASMAAENIGRLGLTNVTLKKGDAALGAGEEAPFDGIILWAGVRALPYELVRQLKDGGRIVAPIGKDIENLNLVRVLKKKDQLFEQVEGEVRFQPLMSYAHGGWDQEALTRAHQVKMLHLSEIAKNEGSLNVDRFLEEFARRQLIHPNLAIREILQLYPIPEEKFIACGV